MNCNASNPNSPSRCGSTSIAAARTGASSPARNAPRNIPAFWRRLEKDYGVDRYVLLGLWGMESSFGDVIENPKYMRQIIPALAALAWGEPRRRKYWETELINALIIVDRGWAQPSGDDRLLWAGAMGPHAVDARSVAPPRRRL